MTDRIEELLGSLATEDEEEQEDVLVLTVPEEAAPAPPREDGRKAGDGGTDDRSGGRTAEEIMRERPGLIAGKTAEGVQISGEIWKDGPVWTVRGAGPEIDRAQRLAAAARTAQAEEILQPLRDGGLVRTGLERAARDGVSGLALESIGRSVTGQAGLIGLYRQTVRGLRPAAPVLPPEQAGRTARAQEPGSAASLAVDELDRAVRRDSRRYDGGMSIY